MLLGTVEEKDSTKACIYLELICHSYNEEMSKVLLGMLSLLSLYSGSVTFLLALYAVSTLEENVQGAIDGTSASLGAMEAIADEEGGILTKLGGASIAEFNNYFTVISAIVNIFYIHLYERRI